MPCGCGGGRVRFDNVPRPVVKVQPNYGVRLNGGAKSPGGAVQSNPNTPVTQQAQTNTTTRTQV